MLFQIISAKPEEADTYRCFANNEYGKAVCTATLNVMGGKRQILTVQYVHCKFIKLENNYNLVLIIYL